MSSGSDKTFSGRCGFIAQYKFTARQCNNSSLICQTKVRINAIIYDVCSVVSVAVQSIVAWVSFLCQARIIERSLYKY
jgi:hypothetical protein